MILTANCSILFCFSPKKKVRILKLDFAKFFKIWLIHNLLTQLDSHLVLLSFFRLPPIIENMTYNQIISLFIDSHSQVPTVFLYELLHLLSCNITELPTYSVCSTAQWSTGFWHFIIELLHPFSAFLFTKKLRCIFPFFPSHIIVVNFPFEIILRLVNFKFLYIWGKWWSL